MTGNLQQSASNYLRQAMRERGVSESSAVTEGVVELFDGITVDQSGLKQCVEKLLLKNSANPLNALLGLIGFRVISENAVNKGLDAFVSIGSVEQAESDGLISYVKLDEETARDAANKVAQSLCRTQDEWSKERHALQEQVNSLQIALNNEHRRTEELQAAATRQIANIAEQIQYLLSVEGQKGSLTDELTALLEDQELTVCWKAAQDTPKESVMFNFLHCANPETRKMKPCILQQGKVLVKGLKYTLADTTAE